MKISSAYKHDLIILFVLMTFSIYAPYNRLFAYVFQIIVFLTIIFMRKRITAVTSVLLFGPTREYIEMSILEQFHSYYGVNGNILSILLLGIMFFDCRENENKLYINRKNISIVLLGILMILSRVWAPYQHEYTTGFSVAVMIYIWFSGFNLNNEDVLVGKLSFVMAGFFSALKIVPYILSYKDLVEYGIVIDGNKLLVDRNYQACFLMICILMSISSLYSYYKKVNFIWKLACIFTIIGDLYIVFAGQSRSAVLCLIIAFFMYAIFNFSKIKKMIVPIVVFIIGYKALINSGIINNLLVRFLAEDISTGNGRSIIWDRYIQGFQEGNIFQILFGHGLVGDTTIGVAAHNIFVSILYSLGICGIVLLIVYILMIIHNYIKTKSKMELMLLIPMLVMCCTIEPYYRIEFSIFIVFMGNLSIKYLKEEKLGEYKYGM